MNNWLLRPFEKLVIAIFWGLIVLRIVCSGGEFYSFLDFGYFLFIFFCISL